MFHTLRCCKLLILLPVLSLALLPVGCGNNTPASTGKTTEFNLAMDLMAAGKNDQAIDSLAAEDIEKCFRESSLLTTNISEKGFMALSESEQSRFHEELGPSVRLIKGAVTKQINELKELQSKGKSEEAGILKDQLQRFADLLKDGNHTLIIESLGSYVEHRLEEVK